MDSFPRKKKQQHSLEHVLLPNADSLCLFHAQEKERGAEEPGTKKRSKIKYKLRITVPSPPMHIFIWRIIIALTYIALNNNAVRPEVRLLSEMGQQSVRGKWSNT